MKDYEEFNVCPDYVTVLNWKKDEETPLLDKEGDLPKWSGDFPPPQIGTRVNITFNRVGPARVVGYFVEYGWLGVLTQYHENPPDWWVKQNGRDRRAHAFGCEIALIED